MAAPTTETISVILPTYRRPESLARCLDSLLGQTRPATEVIVGRRANDGASAEVLARYNLSTAGSVREAVVADDGNLVASMNAALSQSSGDLVALTDDDAEARSDWLKKLSEPFSDPTVGGVGGRDWQPNERWDEAEVGILRWWGKLVGNHHLGSGHARDVDVLKGVNCCFRGDLLRSIGFDRRLRGQGNVSHWELHLCFAVRRRGLRLIYDPAIAIDHHIEQRMDGDTNARGGFERRAFVDEVHNARLAMLEHLPAPRRAIYRIWQAMIGAGATPGLLQVPRRVLRGEPPATTIQRFFATREGCREAEKTWRLSRSAPASEPGQQPTPAGNAAL